MKTSTNCAMKFRSALRLAKVNVGLRKSPSSTIGCWALRSIRTNRRPARSPAARSVPVAGVSPVTVRKTCENQLALAWPVRWAMYLMRGVYFRIISSRLAGSGAGDPPVDFRLLE